MLKKYSIALSLALVLAVLDQWSKIAVMEYLIELGGPQQVTSFFNLVLVANRGISFGLFSDLTYSNVLFAIIAVIISIILLIWMRTMHNWYQVGAIGAIIGGAIGNVIDRLRIGYVVDFLDFHLYEYHWPAFNVADSVIFIGVVLLCIGSIIHELPSKQDKKDSSSKDMENNHA